MRQRRVLHDVPTSPQRPVLQQVSKIDLFPKPKEDYQREQTTAGAAVSAVTVAIICLLVFWEGLGYLVGRDSYDTDLSIDMNANRSMDFNIDISFPKVRCGLLSVDIRDSAGSRRINITRFLQKIPLTHHGEPAYKGYIVDIGSEGAEDNDRSVEGSCTTCFLASDTYRIVGQLDEEGKPLSRKCCSTCAEVMAAYKGAGFNPPEKNRVPQCLEVIAKVNPGCRVIGTLRLKKIPGILVFAPRQTRNTYSFWDIFQFRSDHEINRLVIGDPKAKRFSKVGVASQLEGFKYTNGRVLSEVKYFLSVVSTTYNTRQRQPDSIRTYEYAVQWRAHDLLSTDNRIPAVMFSFDFSPIQIDNYFIRPPFTQFLIKLCGIVGGLFVILGVVDSVVARFMQVR